MRTSLKLAFLALPFAIGWLMPGCGLQGEGQICSTLTNLSNVSSDCDQSVRQLACVPKSGLGKDIGVCCPPGAAASNAKECGENWHPYDYDAGVATTGSAGGGSTSASSSAMSSSASGSTSSTSTTSSGSTSSTGAGVGGGSSTATSSGSSMGDGGM